MAAAGGGESRGPDMASSELTPPQRRQQALPESPAELDRTPASTWRKNERLVYLTNFFHMTMYTMCLGGIFDIFLYSISQQQQHLLDGPVVIGEGAAPPPPISIDTYAEFEMTFSIRPSRRPVAYPHDSACTQMYTCASSIIHLTDGGGNGDCCEVGNRMPALFFDNSSTKLILMMDAEGQGTGLDRRTYWKKQHCFMDRALPMDEWSTVKVEAVSMAQSKGKLSKGTTGAIVLIVNGEKVCEVPGTKYHKIPSRANATLFIGALHGPLRDPHLPANAALKDLKYGKPASNFFVGLINSVQGVLSVALMYPVGWLGDYMNRYTVLQANVAVGAAAAAVLGAAVFYGSVGMLVAGVCVFTLYQQCISSIIYAALADNVTRERRNRAGVNYKTFSALAMSFGPAIQLFVVLVNPSQDSWSMATFDSLLIPGWLLLPVIGLCVWSLTPVGEKISRLPNVDEASFPASRRASSDNLSQGWLDHQVVGSWRRRYVVASSVNIFFIVTLLANGMTVRYFSLYFTQVLKFTPAGLCLLNACCRLWIAGFAQLGKPLARWLGRSNLAALFHVCSALFTLGIYGGRFFQPSTTVACASYLMRFACLHARDPLLYSITMDCVPPSQRSRWASLNSLRTLSFSASAVLGGYLADLHGYQFSFDITVLSLLVGTVFVVPALVWFPRAEGANCDEDLGETFALQTGLPASCPAPPR